MKIKTLRLKDFRGIRELSLDLDPQLTVLEGVNGAGKTAVVEALALLFGCVYFSDQRHGYAEFFEWLLAREGREYELIRDDPGARDVQLEAVRAAVKRALPVENLRVAQKITVVVADTKPPRGRVREPTTKLEELSAGERNTMLLFADIARRLAMTSPPAVDPLEAEGLVLIDDVELHLHPAWQRQVPEKLLRVFPNVQFVLTTHSPQVLSAVPSGKVRALVRQPDGTVTVHTPPEAHGRTSNLILETVFGVSERPEWAKALLHEAYVALDEGRLDDAKRKRTEIEQQIGVDEPELARINLRIERPEARGRG